MRYVLQASILLLHVKETGLLDVREHNACLKQILKVLKSFRGLRNSQRIEKLESIMHDRIGIVA